MVCHSCCIRLYSIFADVRSTDLMRSFSVSNDERSYCYNYRLVFCNFLKKKAVCSSLDCLTCYSIGCNISWCFKYYILRWLKWWFFIGFLNKFIGNIDLAFIVMLHWISVHYWGKTFWWILPWSPVLCWVRRFLWYLLFHYSLTNFPVNTMYHRRCL